MWKLLGSCFVSVSIAALLSAQPEFSPLEQAYSALAQKNYAQAIQQFQSALSIAPARADIRKDLAYTFLKIGESELARDQFRQAMELNPSDQAVSLEFAFLSYETKNNSIQSKALARRTFDAVRRTGNQTAATAFDNVDRPLREGIERWTKALEIGPESSSVHFELAQLAEQRDDPELAAAHYLRAWQMLPQRRSILLDLARVEKAQNHSEKAMSALLAASRGGEQRTSEQARELLPDRYPYVYEFRAALLLDPENNALHRELAFLLLAMADPSAETEFRQIVASAPDDIVSVHQLALITAPVHPVVDAFLMAKRSLDAGFLKDALRYLTIAHESDPSNCDVMLKLGWTNNMLHDDREAVRWFDLARKCPDGSVASEASKAYENLRSSLELFRTTAWVLPFYSSRWNDVFAYGQIKSELHLPRLKVRPYISTRLIADTKPTENNQPLSERSFIVGVGLATQWRRFTAWAEAGSAIGYVTGSMIPDYRGGVSWARAWRSKREYFFESNADEVFISRFGNDWLSYLQTRAGYRWFLLNANLTADTNREHWANFVEMGPGIRFHIPNTPKTLSVSLNALRGIYLVNDGIPQHSSFNDLRVGFWYAVTR